MPFTFSHPAIILPLSKIHPSKLSLTGLIVGSLAPDFEYFILMQMRRTHGHEMSSFIWFNLPICLAIAFIYHCVLKKPLINSLPYFLQERLSIQLQFDWLQYFKKYWFVFAYSAAIGVFSHIFWDSFTHDHGILGKSPSFLLKTTPFINLSVYHTLQWISTFLGGLYIMIYLVNLPSNSVIKIPLLQKMMFWMNVLFLMSVIFILKTPKDLSDFIAVAIGSFLYGLIGSSIYYLIYERIYSTRKAKL